MTPPTALCTHSRQKVPSFEDLGAVDATKWAFRKKQLLLILFGVYVVAGFCLLIIILLASVGYTLWGEEKNVEKRVKDLIDIAKLTAAFWGPGFGILVSFVQREDK